ncbi:MAG: hypothetical protein ACOX87_00030 [Chloroflexota bacterium]|jgi:hypothetical protein
MTNGSSKQRIRLGPSQRAFGFFPLFDPREGITIVEPLGAGKGWWAGAPSVLYDAEQDTFYVSYRQRRPRELGRGGETRIAASRDGVTFKDIWSATKDTFDSPSIERCSLVKTPQGRYRLYVSFVDGADGRWRIDVLEAAVIEELNPSERIRVLTADDIDGEGVKDPYVFMLGPCWYMLASCTPKPDVLTPDVASRMHATADIYNTGIVKSLTGLAYSHDGLHWQWEGFVLTPPERGWDAYCTRIGAFLYRPPVFTAFYDGSASVEGNYEERTGIAVSTDLRSWRRVSVDGPVLTSPNASGSLRYLDAIEVNGALYYYYEFAREDGSHELRVSRVRL